MVSTVKKPLVTPESLIPAPLPIETPEGPAGVEQAFQPLPQGLVTDRQYNAITPVGAMVTDQAALEQQQAILRAEAGPLDAAFYLESSIHSLTRNMYEAQVDQDTDFVPSEEQINAALEGIEGDMKEQGLKYLMEATSERNFNLRTQWLHNDIRAEDQLAAHGGLGLAARMGAALVDPANIALMATGAGAAAAAGRLGLTASRLGMILAGGSLTAAENAAIEAILADTQGTRGSSDVFMAAGIGFALGGLGGTLATRAAGEIADDTSRLIRLQRNAEAGHVAERLVDEGVPRARAQQIAGVAPEVARANQRIVTATLDDVRQIEAAQVEARPAHGPRSVGAAEDPDAPAVKDMYGLKSLEERPDFEEILDTKPLPGTQWDADGKPRIHKGKGAWRFDMGGRLRQSKNPVVNWIGRRLLVDGSGDGGAEVAGDTAEEIGRHMVILGENRLRRGSMAAIAAWKKERGLTNPLTNWAAERQYWEEVSRVVRSGAESTDPNIRAGVAAFREARDYIAEEAQRVGVKGFEGIELNPNHVPRVWQNHLISEFRSRFGDNAAIKLIAKSLRMEGGHMSSKTANKIANAFWKRLVTKGHDLNMDRVFAAQDVDNLRQVLADDLGLDANTIDEVVGLVEKTPKPDKGAVARGKMRLRMDESVSIRMKDADGYEHVIGIDRLLENDASALLSRYAHQVGGAIGLARAGFTDLADFDKMVDTAYKYGIDRLGMSPEVAEHEAKILMHARDMILGRSVEDNPGGWLSQFGRTMRDYNFMRVMNQVGIAQLADISNILGQGGIKNTIQYLPELFRMVKRIKETGKLSDDLAEELEVFIGSGTDMLRGQPINRIADLTDDLGLPTAKTPTGRMVHDFGAKGRQFVTKISGMGPINVVMQRMTMKVVAHRMAAGILPRMGKPWSKARLRSMGLDDAMYDRIKAQIQQHADVVDGSFASKKLRVLNLERWTDMDARDAFSMAVFRQTRRIVQENDIGTQHMMFGKSPIMKLLLQFRSFMLTAYTKQLRHNLQFMDEGVLVTYPLSLLIGTATYIGQTHMNAAGRDDRKAYLNRMLTEKRIAEAALMRTAWASLVPAVVGTLTQWGLPPELHLFKQGRVSGLNAEGILGNPTIDLFNNLIRGTGGLLSRPLDSSRQYTSSDFRALWSTLMFQNAFGMRQLGNLLSAQFPKERKQ